MVTPIEVLDSAVKIGLGALIGGVVSYMAARLSLEKDRALACRGILAEIVDLANKEPNNPTIEAKLHLLGEKRSLIAYREFLEAKGYADRFPGATIPAELHLKSKQDAQDAFFDSLSQAFRRL